MRKFLDYDYLKILLWSSRLTLLRLEGNNLSRSQEFVLTQGGHVNFQNELLLAFTQVVWSSKTKQVFSNFNTNFTLITPNSHSSLSSARRNFKDLYCNGLSGACHGALLPKIPFCCCFHDLFLSCLFGQFFDSLKLFCFWLCWSNFRVVRVV